MGTITSRKTSSTRFVPRCCFCSDASDEELPHSFTDPDDLWEFASGDESGSDEESDGEPFQVGEAVEALHRNGEWQQARIESECDDGSFMLSFTDSNGDP